MNYVSIRYEFDVYYSSSEGERIRSAIKGNATKLLEDFFNDPDSLLYDLHRDPFGLDFSERAGDLENNRVFEDDDAASEGGLFPITKLPFHLSPHFANSSPACSLVLTANASPYQQIVLKQSTTQQILMVHAIGWYLRLTSNMIERYLRVVQKAGS